MSQRNKYVTKNEIEEFLDNLKLENYAKEHKQIKTFVLGYMLKNPPGSDRAVQVGTFGKTPGSAAPSQDAHGLIISYVCPRPIPLIGDQSMQKQIEEHLVYCRYDGSTKQYVIQIHFNRFNETAPQKETSVTEENKDQCVATKHGPTLTVEEITGILIDLGVSENDVKESFFHLPTKLAIGKLPNVTIHRVDDKITLTYGNTEKATLLDKAAAQDARLPDSMRLSPEEIRYEAFDDVVNQSGLYIYTVSPKEETKMLYPPKTTIQILKPIYRDRLQKAGLSDEAVQFISDEIFHGRALKAPKEDSSFVVVAGKDVLNVYYSHDNKSVTLTDIETTKTTSSGEVVSYSTGTSCAFFVVDTSNTQEKLIVKHVGVPKVKLELSNGYSVNLPFKKTYETVDRDQVLVRITCDTLLSLSSKVLQNLTGPALTDLQETEPARYFIGGLQLTEKVFRKRTVPGAGSWADIE